jgi:hypothetical protein
VILTEHCLGSFLHALDQAGMLQLSTRDKSFRDILGLQGDEVLTTTDVASYFPEFQNTYDIANMEIDIYTIGDSRIEMMADPEEDESHMTGTFPTEWTFKVDVGKNDKPIWVEAFKGVINLETDIDL